MGDHRSEPTLAPECLAAITAAFFFGAAVFAAVAGLLGIWNGGLFVALMLLAPAVFLAGMALAPPRQPRDDLTDWD